MKKIPVKTTSTILISTATVLLSLFVHSKEFAFPIDPRINVTPPPSIIKIKFNGSELSNGIYRINLNENHNIKHNGYIAGFKNVYIPVEIKSTNPLKIAIDGYKNVWFNDMSLSQSCSEHPKYCRSFKYILYNHSDGSETEIQNNYTETNHKWVGSCKPFTWCKYELRIIFNPSENNRGALMPGSYGIGYNDGRKAPKIWLRESM